MNILHYSLGLPPFRSGGLTKYSLDLMREQLSQQNNVSLLYPGTYSIKKGIRVRKEKDFENIKVFEMINPLPVPLLNGVENISEYIKETNSLQIFITFLKKTKPDIIHIHTLMGLPQDFLNAAKKNNIKIIYTTHDYFGLCPTVNLLDCDQNICVNFNSGEKCTYCNQNAFSMKKVYIMQSKLYRKIKNTSVIKKVRKQQKNKTDILIEKNRVNNVHPIQYVKLRKYYIEMLKKIDFFHFNSSIAQEVFQNYLNCKGKIINITHKDIEDRRILKDFSGIGKLKILFLGPTTSYKGFELLYSSLQKLLSEGLTNWELHVYGNDTAPLLKKEEYGFIYFHGRYSYNQLPKILKQTDFLIVPSIWKETFGFTTLEGISFGVPVIVTNNVGAKDIVEKYKVGYVVKSIEELSIVLKTLTKNTETLKKFNENIMKINFKSFLMENHTKEILNLYFSVIKGESK